MSSELRLKSVLEDIRDSGKIDPRSLKELTVQERQLIRDLHNDGLVNEALKFIVDLDPDQEWLSIREKMSSPKIQMEPLWKCVLRYAAIFIGILSIAYFFQTGSGTENETRISQESIRLKMGEDGTKIIREGENRQIVSVSGKVVGEQMGNKIHYDPNAEIDELIYNELEDPLRENI
jgi:hypothetical protein